MSKIKLIQAVITRPFYLRPPASKLQLLRQAVYHLRENHTVTLYEMREKMSYQLRNWS